jgi:hypothetical protein
MPSRREGVHWLLPGRAELPEPLIRGNCLNPSPRHGRPLLPSHVCGHPTNAAAHNPQGATGAPLLLTQDGLGGYCHANAANNNVLMATALFRLPPVAQGTKRRFGNATDHTAVDNALTGNVGNVDNALTGTVGNANKALTSAADNVDNALTGTVNAAKFGTQVTGTSDDGTNDAPPSLTQGKTVDGGNEGEERGDPGPIAQGEGGTVRARDVKGEEDLGRQILHACNNQLVMVVRLLRPNP